MTEAATTGRGASLAALDTRPDHVAVAVPDPEVAAGRWRDTLGGGFVSNFDNGIFRGRQYAYRNGAKVELLGPSPDDHSAENFLRVFLRRYGTRVHHLTLKVADLRAAIDAVEAAGLDVVDVNVDDPHWKEGFLRPSQVGGIVVQLAEADHSDAEWAAHRGVTPQPPAPDAAALVGLRLAHPDLDRAAEIWALLGADVTRDGPSLRARWRGSALEVVVDEGDRAAPLALRFAGASDLPHQEGVGPPVEAVG